MKKLLFTAALAMLGVGSLAADALAHGHGPFGSIPSGAPRKTFFHKYPVPAFQAAPWYLYWPYNAHFQTPGPLTGPYYAPPYTGGGLVNPYFPTIPAAPAFNPAP